MSFIFHQQQFGRDECYPMVRIAGKRSEDKRSKSNAWSERVRLIQDLLSGSRSVEDHVAGRTPSQQVWCRSSRM